MHIFLYLVQIVHPIPCSSEYDQMLIIKFGISCFKKSSYLNFKAIFAILLLLLFFFDFAFFSSSFISFWVNFPFNFVNKKTSNCGFSFEIKVFRSLFTWQISIL